MSVENAYIALPLGIFRKDAIISITRNITEIDKGAFQQNQILPVVEVRMIDGSSHSYNCSSVEERDNLYAECVKILTTNN